MSNTVEYKGNVYEIGKRYEFSDCGDDWYGIELECFIDGQYPCKSTCNSYKQIRAIEPSSIGTITKAPVKLIDGEAYQFDYDGSKALGYFNKEKGDFTAFNDHLAMKYCTNIVKLVPEKQP